MMSFDVDLYHVDLAGIEPQPCASVLLMPGSLLIFNQEAYSNCLHGIAEVKAASVWAPPSLPSFSVVS